MPAAEPLILIVEDDSQMRRFLRASLGSRGFRVVEAATVADALRLVTTEPPDIILLDLVLPDGTGIELTQRIREWSRVPVIIVSARGRETDKVDALDAGADDYLTKPFGVNELLARIRVGLRHAQEQAGGTPNPIELGKLRVDLARREVTFDGHEVRLSPIEYRLLALLARNAGKVLTHRQLLAEIWGPDHVEQSHYLRVYMAQLRRKIEPEPARPRLLITEPGVGYRLRDRVETLTPR